MTQMKSLFALGVVAHVANGAWIFLWLTLAILSTRLDIAPSEAREGAWGGAGLAFVGVANAFALVFQCRLKALSLLPGIAIAVLSLWLAATNITTQVITGMVAGVSAITYVLARLLAGK
jgi:hypothetical protein